ncbi:hypothetical protein LshimejAT787_0700130 [Lyophyllum shimeji]|uniref:Uncharacterized protein n=1 Tax=Lyophyllum shimeji TaxID=47721 RepID=A0A9P3UNB5_LYOSH|nr:hypothetical protein LshimejAT787_0700130 [Lyophyllum shimeji]
MLLLRQPALLCGRLHRMQPPAFQFSPNTIQDPRFSLREDDRIEMLIYAECAHEGRIAFTRSMGGIRDGCTTLNEFDGTRIKVGSSAIELSSVPKPAEANTVCKELMTPRGGSGTPAIHSFINGLERSHARSASSPALQDSVDVGNGELVRRPIGGARTRLPVLKIATTTREAGDARSGVLKAVDACGATNLEEVLITGRDLVGFGREAGNGALTLAILPQIEDDSFNERKSKFASGRARG